ncbi:MAG: trypsin-like peptidase domain-containing protein [Gaiellales bacterium]
MRPAPLADALRSRVPRGRALALTLGALVAAGVGSGAAIASTSAAPIGTGVVVIRTTLGYQSGSAAGTGMVLTSSGEVLTNNHVIRGATTIRVVVPATSRTYTATVVGYDMTDDVAVLQVAGASNLKTVSTADSSTLATGSPVTALGNAGGTGRLASATGTITRLRQSIVVNDDQGGAIRLSGLIGTNASVEPGDSGGPLLNSAGDVIGMDTAASTGPAFRSTTATVGYAIPISKALAIERQVVSGNATTRIHLGKTPFLGVQIASELGRGPSSAGAVVEGVVSGGPAASAGLASGDVITAIDGHAISSSRSITSVILAEKLGATVTITYTHQFGGSLSTTATLAVGPPQ